MGEITIDGIVVDTEDIDLLVRFKPLAELDRLVDSDKQILAEMPSDDEVRPYWEHRYETHRIAREIAEWQFESGIPTVDLPKEVRDRTQGLYALEICRKLEDRLMTIENYLKKKKEYASKRKKYTIK